MAAASLGYWRDETELICKYSEQCLPMVSTSDLAQALETQKRELPSLLAKESEKGFCQEVDSLRMDLQRQDEGASILFASILLVKEPQRHRGRTEQNLCPSPSSSGAAGSGWGGHLWKGSCAMRLEGVGLGSHWTLTAKLSQ